MTPPPGWQLFPSGSGFEAQIGPLYQQRDPADGSIALGFSAAAPHLNRQGQVHGGILVALADTVCGFRVWQAGAGAPCVTVSLACDFLAAARAGEFVIGRAEVVRMGQSLVFVTAELTVDGMAILKAQGVWKKRAQGRTAPHQGRTNGPHPDP
jgi:uncharacterized protein (TIGR00369 family)